jgi:hypothetical protein
MDDLAWRNLQIFVADVDSFERAFVASLLLLPCVLSFRACMKVDAFSVSGLFCMKYMCCWVLHSKLIEVLALSQTYLSLPKVAFPSSMLFGSPYEWHAQPQNPVDRNALC